MGKEGLYEKKKGRRRYDPHVRLYHWLLPAMMDRLSGNAVKLLIYMLSYDNGSNNGDIFMSARTAAEGINVTKKTALKMLEELDRAGFIRPTQQGYFNIKTKDGPATAWRFTFQAANGKAPTHEWKQATAADISWRAERNSRGEKLRAVGVKITPLRLKQASTGVEITPGTHGNPPNSFQPTGVESSTQTVATAGRLPADLPAPDLDPEIAGGKIAARAGGAR